MSYRTTKPVYKLEYAVSGRAACKGRKPCNGTLIELGALRFGSLVDVGEQSWFSFRHWGCVTSAQIGNFLAAYGYESSPEIIQGFEKLTPEDQAKVALAYSVGHVADEDIPETARKGPQTPRTPNSSHVERVEPPTPTPKRSRSDPIVKGVKRGKKISYEVDLEHGNSDDDQAEVDYDAKPVVPAYSVTHIDLRPTRRSARNAGKSVRSFVEAESSEDEQRPKKKARVAGNRPVKAEVFDQ